MNRNVQGVVLALVLGVFLLGCWIIRPARYQMASEAGGNAVLVLDTQRGTVTKYFTDEKGQVWFISMTSDALRADNAGAKLPQP